MRRRHKLIVAFCKQEVRVMMRIIKIGEPFLAALIFIGLWGATSNALEADSKAPGGEGILLKEEYVPDNYCHQKLPAIRESSMAGDHPVLSVEETIDFYGPCNQDPLGIDRVHDQRRQNTDRRSH
jgi:hypothetical protein